MLTFWWDGDAVTDGAGVSVGDTAMVGDWGVGGALLAGSAVMVGDALMLWRWVPEQWCCECGGCEWLVCNIQHCEVNSKWVKNDCVRNI